MNWIRATYRLEQELDHFGILAFLAALKDWWSFRPMIVKCEGCQRKIWHNGPPQAPIFCNQYCLASGPPSELLTNEDEIPF
jgi:hypothetical protein